MSLVSHPVCITLIVSKGWHMLHKRCQMITTHGQIGTRFASAFGAALDQTEGTRPFHDDY